MNPYYSDSWLTVYGGDCRDVLRTMPDESVHCVVTSPPYWGLRDYGTATWDGGDPECDHRHQLGGEGSSSAKQNTSAGTQTIAYRDTCRKCGATRIDNQLGLEPTPEQYVENMVAVFREVRRVLRNDGTLWLNLGDSYAGSWGAQSRGNHTGDDKTTLDGHPNGLNISGRQIAEHPHFGQFTGTRALQNGRKPKDLTGIPWMVAFALRSDGWYLRSDIIWAKPNPMPESVTDRPTKSHEYLFLLSKAPRYHFDAEAVRTPAIAPTCKMPDGWDTGPGGHGSYHRNGREKGRRTDKQRGHGRRHAGFNDRWDAMKRTDQIAGGANIRTVWNVATKPYPDAHFATFPPKLVEPCVLAGCPELGTVLDPFAGSGTTGLVAQRLSRRAILIDLNPDYLRQQLDRNAALPLGLSA